MTSGLMAHASVIDPCNSQGHVLQSMTGAPITDACGEEQNTNLTGNRTYNKIKKSGGKEEKNSSVL